METAHFQTCFAKSLVDFAFKNTHNMYIIKLILHFVSYNIIFIALRKMILHKNKVQ